MYAPLLGAIVASCLVWKNIGIETVWLGAHGTVALAGGLAVHAVGNYRDAVDNLYRMVGMYALYTAYCVVFRSDWMAVYDWMMVVTACTELYGDVDMVCAEPREGVLVTSQRMAMCVVQIFLRLCGVIGKTRLHCFIL
jgi:hypothetical protein